MNHTIDPAATAADAAKRRVGNNFELGRIFAVFSADPGFCRFSHTCSQGVAEAATGRYERQIIVQERTIVRISRFFFAASIVGLLIVPATASAQDTAQNGKSDTEAPPEAAAQFGPRKQLVQDPNAPQGPQAETISTHGKWEVQCTTVPAAEGQPAEKACGMVQSGFSEKSNEIGVQVIVSRVKQGDKTATVMRVLAPIGVYLPTGIPMEIDGTALPGRMQFTRCLPRICESYGEASTESLGKLKKGKAITFFLYDRPGSSYPIKLPLAGFGDALAVLAKQ